jgi:S-adenosylmethionine hydrolase
MSRRPVITLTTDFGAGSPYVAAMKAALLAGCPEAALVDVSHAVSAFDMESAGFVLWAGTRHFSAGAVHLAVVDPGVGTARRPLAVQLGHAYWVAPDNGLLSLLLRESDLAPAAVELRRPEGARDRLSLHAVARVDHEHDTELVPFAQRGRDHGQPGHRRAVLTHA